MNTEVLYGIHPVSEALKAGRRSFVGVYVSKGKKPKRFEQALGLAQHLKIPVMTIDPAPLKSMAGTDSHQGICARVSAYKPEKFSDIVHNITSGQTNPFLLLLDNIVDPNNLGAIIRTALCVGIDGICIPRDRSATPTPAVSKASAGALEHVRLAQVANMVNTIRVLKKNGLWIAGMDAAGDRSIFSFDFTDPMALVIGGEEKGIRPLVKKSCDFLISIPQQGPMDSLNASVAGSVAMYEGFRQRKYPGKTERG